MSSTGSKKKNPVGISTDSMLAVSQAISSVGVAFAAAKNIEKVIVSLQGIVDQAGREELAHRKERLEMEAGYLLAAIDDLAASEAPDGSKPLQGDAIQIKSKELPSYSVELSFSQVSKSSLGFSTMSDRASFAEMSSHIADALALVKNLQNEIQSGSESIDRLLQTHEVAHENNDAANAQVLDLNQALRTSKTLKLCIFGSRDEALRAQNLTPEG